MVYNVQCMLSYIYLYIAMYNYCMYCFSTVCISTTYNFIVTIKKNVLFYIVWQSLLYRSMSWSHALSWDSIKLSHFSSQSVSLSSSSSSSETLKVSWASGCPCRLYCFRGFWYGRLTLSSHQICIASSGVKSATLTASQFINNKSSSELLASTVRFSVLITFAVLKIRSTLALETGSEKAAQPEQGHSPNPFSEDYWKASTTQIDNGACEL